MPISPVSRLLSTVSSILERRTKRQKKSSPRDDDEDDDERDTSLDRENWDVSSSSSSSANSGDTDYDESKVVRRADKYVEGHSCAIPLHADH